MLKTLICDDEKTIREGLADYINMLKMPINIVKLVQDGQEAIDAVKTYLPDLIFIDINMPNLNGLDAIKEILIYKPDTIVIIVSGYADFEYAKRAIDLGVFKYLLKPLNLSELELILKEVTNKYIQSNNGEITLFDDNDYISYINQKFNDPSLNLNYLADIFKISPSKLSRHIKEKTSLTFTDYLNSLRINYAKKLLISNVNYNMCEISIMCGYSSQHYFSRIFKNYTGVAPINYK